MRILHVIYSHINNPLSAGGSALRTHEVYRRMVARHEVTVVTAAWPRGPREEEIDGVRYLHLGRPRKGEGLSRAGFTWTMNQVCRGAKRWGADLLVVDISPFTPCFAPWLSSLPQVGVVQSWIDPLGARQKHGWVGPWAVKLRDATLRRFTYLIAVSPTIEEELGRYRQQRTEIRLIPYGFDTGVFSYNGKCEKPYFLSLGRIEEFTKGLDLLIEAYSRTRERLRDMKLVIAGRGSFEGELRDMVGTRGLSDAVEFVGWVEGEAKAKLMQECMAFCFPSRRESWGMAAVEAAACEKPVIGFDVPGVRDAVRNGETGILVPAEDVEAYAQAMVRVVEDAELRRRLGEAGRKWASQFTWDETARKQEEFYLHVLEQEGEGRRT